MQMHFYEVVIPIKPIKPLGFFKEAFSSFCLPNRGHICEIPGLNFRGGSFLIQIDFGIMHLILCIPKRQLILFVHLVRIPHRNLILKVFPSMLKPRVDLWINRGICFYNDLGTPWNPPEGAGVSLLRQKYFVKLFNYKGKLVFL